jgi:uncharacterized protein (TIGR03437 family)
MKRTFSTLALALLVCAAATAAPISTTLTVNASGGFGGSGISATGTATLTNIGSGTFSGTVSLTPDSSGNYSAPFTIKLTGGADTITGTLKIPPAVLTGSGTASASITGGTYGGGVATGSFPSLAGTGSLSGTSITLSFTGAGTITTIAGGGTPVPTISAVQDAASYTSNIAQGSIFVVKGSNLAPTGFTPFAPPRPTVSSSGVKITFAPAGGGAGTDVYLVYLCNTSTYGCVGDKTQLSGILPSTVAVGSYNVTVTNGTVSAPFAAQVVANKIGLFTQSQDGTGLASVQNYIAVGVADLNRLTTGILYPNTVYSTTISPAHPGQAVIAYGTGLGGYAAGDNSASPALDFRSSETIVAIVGGVTIPVDYAGRAGYAGQDQINFTLPGNVQTGCAVPLQISVNGNLSAATTISIAPDANSSACVMPGYTLQQLKNFDNGGTYTIGGFSITQFTETVQVQGQGQTVKLDSISGAFSQITGFQLGAAATANPTVGQQSGSCMVIPFTTAGSTSGVSAGGKLTSLDAGTITINGPTGSSLTNQALTEDASYDYSYTSYEGLGITGQASFSLVAGTYTLSGAGGKDVGAFSTSLTLGSPLTITGGLPSTVIRSAGLPLNWTGGNTSDVVVIVGLSETSTGTGSSAVTTGAEFICTTTAGQGGFTVPASILTQLPASTTGILEMSSGNNTASFTASLKAGGSIDVGYFGAFLGIGAAPAYQ